MSSIISDTTNKYFHNIQKINKTFHNCYQNIHTHSYINYKGFQNMKKIVIWKSGKEWVRVGGSGKMWEGGRSG